MNKLTIGICATFALVLGAYAEIAQYSLGGGENDSPGAAKIVGIKVNSSVTTGTITVKDIIDVASVADAYKVVTNIVEKGADYRVADALVGNIRVYTGSDATDWVRWNATVTNVANSVTNVITYKLAKWCDGAVTNSVVWTNSACSIKFRDVIATAPVTNIVRRNYQVWTHTPYTNTLYTGTLSSGALSADITNKFILGGSTIVGEGSVFTNSGAKTAAFLILEK